MSSAICFTLDQSNILSYGNGLTTLRKEPFENNLRKGENADNKHFLLSHNVCYPITSIFLCFKTFFFLLSAKGFDGKR